MTLSERERRLNIGIAAERRRRSPRRRADRESSAKKSESAPFELVDGHGRHADAVGDQQPRQLGAVDSDLSNGSGRRTLMRVTAHSRTSANVIITPNSVHAPMDHERIH